MTGLGMYYLGFYTYLFYKFSPNNLILDVKDKDKNKYNEL